MLNRAQMYGGWRRIVPSPEPVIFRSRLAGDNQGSFDSYDLSYAKRKKLDKQDIALVGLTASIDMCRWELWQEWLDTAVAVSPATLPVPEPKQFDVIEDIGGVGYVIDHIQIKMFGLVYSCLCSKKV